MAGELGLPCATCGKQTLHRQTGGVNHILHFLIMFLTCGLWGFVWIILAVTATSAPYVCTFCGTPALLRADGAQSTMAPMPPSSQVGTKRVLLGFGAAIGLLILVGAVVTLLIDRYYTQVASPSSTLIPPSTLQPNIAHSALLGRSEDGRRQALLDAVKKVGQDCDSVMRTFLQGTTREEEALWNVRCANGKAYVIGIRNDARNTTRVLSCTFVEDTKERCFGKLP